MKAILIFVALTLAAACGSAEVDTGNGASNGSSGSSGEGGGGGNGRDGGTSGDNENVGGNQNQNDATENANTNDSGTGNDNQSGNGNGNDSQPPTASCQLDVDYEANASDVIVIEAEDLPLSAATNGDSWQTGSDVDITYIEWDGNEHFSNPGVAIISVDIGVRTPGRYRLLWHTQIGKGTNTTEHNDNWVRFSGMAADPLDEPAFYFGARDTNTEGVETRRYARPYCNDASFIAEIEALPSVEDDAA